MSATTVRPTKKQRELLTFIEQFITQHGYSPSYREIMTGLNYTSVATVALHINNLIKRGHLRKRDHSARSLEVMTPTASLTDPKAAKTAGANEEQWLLERVNGLFAELEAAKERSAEQVDQLHALVTALKVLGFEEAAVGFVSRLASMREQVSS